MKINISPCITSISKSPIALKLNLKMAYTLSITLTKFIDRGKDKLDLMAQQDVVYKISYHDCDFTWISPKES